MSQRLAGLGITGHLPTHLVLHITLVLVLVPLLLLKILIARRYKHSHFVTEGARSNHFRDCVRACGPPHVFGTSSFGEPWKLGAKARDWCRCCSVPCPVRLGVQEAEAATCFHRVVGHSGDFRAADPSNQPQKRDEPQCIFCCHRSSSKRTTPKRCAFPGSRQKTALC